MVYDTRSTVHGQRITVSGSRPDKVCARNDNCVPGTNFNSGTHETQWWRGLQRMCAMCAMCAIISEFLLENILKHIIDFERKLIEKAGTHGTHLWNYYVSSLFPVELLAHILAHTWHTPPSKWHTPVCPYS